MRALIYYVSTDYNGSFCLFPRVAPSRSACAHFPKPVRFVVNSLRPGRNGFLVSSSSKSHESLGERTSPGEFYQFNLFLIPFSCLGIVFLKVRLPCARKFIVIHLRGFFGRGILPAMCTIIVCD